jgi:hypothetical protein
MNKLLLVALSTTVLLSCGQSTNKSNKKETTEKKAVSLKAVDLSSKGIPLTINAPEGAVVNKDSSMNEISVDKDRFMITIKEEKYEDDKTLAQWKESIKEQSTTQSELTAGYLKTEVLKDEPTGFIYMTTNKSGGKSVAFKCFVEKNKKKYLIESNDIKLMDFEKAMNNDGWAVDKEEIQVMYDAVKKAS